MPTSRAGEREDHREQNETLAVRGCSVQCQVNHFILSLLPTGGLAIAVWAVPRELTVPTIKRQLSVAVVAGVVVITPRKFDEHTRLVTYRPRIMTWRQQHNIVF